MTTLHSDHWRRLAALATLGMSRQSIGADELWSPVLGDDVPTTLTPPDAPATGLLRAAAATHLLLLAAQRSKASTLSVPPIESAESLPYIPELSCWRLAQMLTTDMRVLAGEWCEIASRNKRIIPPHWLPSYLPIVSPEELRAMRPLFGTHYEWIARQQSTTTVPAVALNTRETWINSTVDERKSLLTQLQHSDKIEARTLVELTWDEDSPEARASFLAILSNRIDSSYEPLFERALDDKRKAVRQSAAEGLARITHSAHQKRMIGRASTLIAFDANAKGLLGIRRKPTLTISLPETLTADAVRDGVDAKPPAHLKIGERSFWLLQILSVIAPSHWSSQFATDPQTLLKAAAETDYVNNLLEAFAAATIRHADSLWAAALCDYWVDHLGDQATFPLPIAPLLAALNPIEREKKIAELFARADLTTDTICQLIAAVEGLWSGEFTQLSLRTLINAMRRESRQWRQPQDTLLLLAQRADTDTALKLLPQLSEVSPESSSWHNAAQRCIDMIEFRHSMKMELLQLTTL